MTRWRASGWTLEVVADHRLTGEISPAGAVSHVTYERVGKITDCCLVTRKVVSASVVDATDHLK
jgi:hypothetical protein